MSKKWLTIITTIMLVSFIQPSNYFLDDSDNEMMNTSRQGWQVTVDCSDYEFNDLFAYTIGEFVYTINDDWSSATINASLEHRDEKANSIREQWDLLFDGNPGGNNNWISTDEIEAIEALMPDCMDDFNTRIHIKEGDPSTVNSTYADNTNMMVYDKVGLSINPENAVITNHSDERQCTNFGASTDCREIPTSATDSFITNIGLKPGNNHNLQFNQLPNLGVENFTIIIDQRQDYFESYSEIKLILPEVENLNVVYSSCGGEVKYGADGRLAFTSNTATFPHRCVTHFTTVIPNNNLAPFWTDKPENGTVIPIMTGEDFQLPIKITDLGDDDLQEITNFGYGVSNMGLSLNCEFEKAGWFLYHIDSLSTGGSTNFNDGLFVNSPPNSISSNATCHLKDYFGAKTDSVELTFGQPFLYNTTINNNQVVDFSIENNQLVESMNITAGGVQLFWPYKYTGDNSITITNETLAILQIPITNLLAGDFVIGGDVNSSSFLYRLQFASDDMLTKLEPEPNNDGDNDGVVDNEDDFPNDGNETTDSDGDGVGDNADLFPNDANETNDDDSDGVGNNTDAFPQDGNETHDDDGDGVGNNTDAFPQDANETMDTDGDGVGDNADPEPEDPSISSPADIEVNVSDTSAYLISGAIVFLAIVIIFVRRKPPSNTDENYTQFAYQDSLFNED